MSPLRRIVLIFFILFPLVTLIHKNERGRWDLQCSAMAGPDEFSYLLMADHFLKGGSLSLKDSLGRDTFYPPGYPLLLAAWTKITTGSPLTAFTAHALNATLLSLDTLIVYLFSRRILNALTRSGHRRFQLSENALNWLPLLIAGIFAANWHVLESSLLILSEPAFMLATFAWLAIALKWPNWPTSLPKTFIVALFAILAWSIRGAGIVCVATTFAYPLLGSFSNLNLKWPRRLASIFLIALLALSYQGILTKLSPEKSLAAGEQSANSYPRQLLHGLTNGHRLTFSNLHDYPALAANLIKLIFDHLDDYASSFVPWPRENPDFHFRNITGKIFGFLGLLGWLWHIGRFGNLSKPASALSAMRFVELFILFYFALYLVWPFDFARFWSPILPIMLVYGADSLVRFPQLGTSRKSRAAPGTMPLLLLSLLLALSIEEAALQLNNYARRLNYVSDSLAASAAAIIHRSPDPQKTQIAVMGGDDHFALAWYFLQARPNGDQYRIHSPQPHLPSKNGKAETPAELLVRLISETKTPSPSPRADTRIYFFSYFSHLDAITVLSEVRQKLPPDKADTHIDKIFQQEIIVAVWELRSNSPQQIGP